MQLEHRTHEDVELRIDDTDGRTICGTCVPFGMPTQIGNRFIESFRKGAFTKTIKERGSKVQLLAAHDHKALPLGRATHLTETDDGLYGEFRISKTRLGDEVLELVKDGALNSFSIGFVPLRDKWSSDRKHVERTEVRLHEVSVVTFPAYEGAAITAVRDFDADDDGVAPRLAVARRRLLTL